MQIEEKKHNKIILTAKILDDYTYLKERNIIQYQFDTYLTLICVKIMREMS